jgi:hypothetical protein
MRATGRQSRAALRLRSDEAIHCRHGFSPRDLDLEAAWPGPIDPEQVEMLDKDLADVV